MTLDPAHVASLFDAPHARLDMPEGKLAYYRFGKGPDVVAIHGWPLHAATFRTLVPHLADDFTLHLFDLPGVGRTTWRGAIGFEAHAAAIRRAVDALGLARYALLAHDSGGVTARLVAAEDPRVSGLVLSGSEIPGHHPPLLQMLLLGARVPVVGSLLTAGMQFGPVRRSRLGFGTCFTDPAYADGDFADLFVRPLAQKQVAAGQMALLASFDFALVDRLADVHARIRAPTLCIWGERDPWFPVPKARAMLPQFAGGAELATIPGAKLFVHEDHPAAYASYAGPFLGRIMVDEGKARRAHAEA
jgi:pimeloyl-ACP methyl ester carboxylesterase